MKSFFLKSLVAAGVCATSASALSLYETAPMVGFAESQTAQYFASVNFGYDTNPQGTTNKKARHAGSYVNASVSSTFADVESVNKLTYNVRLGGTRYLGNATEGGGRKYYGDCSADVTYSHAFSSMSRYTGSLHVSYMPEPGYDNGFSSAGMMGDTLSWSFHNSYSQAIDMRWSWNAGFNVSGTHYSEKSYSYDDRQYYSASAGLNYRASDRLTYTSSISYRWEERTHGDNSRSAFASVGFQYALDPVSTLSASVGAQCKMMDDDTNVNPTLNLGYRRRVTDGLSLNTYVSYSDENVNNYNRHDRSSYRSCGAWRAGLYGTYVLSPDVSFVFGGQAMYTEYSKSTRGAADSERITVKPSVTMNYNFTSELQGSVGAEYTYYTYERQNDDSMYSRWRVWTGVTYRF